MEGVEAAKRADRPSRHFLAQALRDPRRTDVKRLARVVDEKVMRPVPALAQGLGTRRLLIAPEGRSTSFLSPPSLTGRAATWSNVTRSVI